MDILLKYLSVLFAFVVVMLILLLTTKYLTYKSKTMLKGNYMQIIESLSLGINLKIHLVRVDREFFIISSSLKNIDFLARVDIDDFQEEEIKNPISGVIDFKSVLKNYINGVHFGKQPHNDAEKLKDNVPDQKDKVIYDTNNNVIKDNLEKLRNLNKSINGQRSENEQTKEI